MSLGATYLVGPTGVRIVWPDGTADTLPALSVVRLERLPRRITGKLYALEFDGSLGFEAPEVRPKATA